MELLHGVRTYLGLGGARLEEGFRTSERGSRLPACRRCGALVAHESQRLHADWHAAADA